MPVVPRSMSGRRPQRSTVAMATSVKRTPAPLMTTCCSRPASTPVEALMVLNMVAPKYMKTLMPGDLLEDGQRDARGGAGRRSWRERSAPHVALLP